VASSYRRSTQREPAPERYKEIQQSLADKGYFAGPVNGTWNSDSVEALKRFQRDQNIGDDGKLGSLSLIALGLGPKRGTEKSENSETSPTPP
jgi:peptidoglycan hydrolase-like protein with peptidoglycan-binding domain